MTILSKDYATEPVPAEEGRGLIKLLAVFIAFTVNLASLLMGAQIGMNASGKDVIIGTVIGGIVLSVIGGMTSLIGAKTKLSTGMISTLTFGRYGKNFIAALFTITLFGWFGVQTEIFADTLGQLCSDVLGLSMPRVALVIFGGVLMSSTAIIGFKALEKLSLVSVILMFILLSIPLFRVSFGDALSDPEGVTHSFSLQTVISLVAGSFMVGAVIMPDMMRYARSKRIGVLTTCIGFSVLYPLLIIFAAVLARATGQSDIVQLFLALGLGIPALLTIILATWTTNDSNLYTASLSLSAIFQGTRKWVLASIAGALGTVLAATGLVMAYFIPVLLFLGVFAAPIGGVIIGDFFARPDAYDYKHLIAAPRFKIAETLFLFVGVMFGLATTPLENNGFGLFELTTIPLLDGLLCSAILTFIYKKFAQ
jgi:cytosine permease